MNLSCWLTEWWEKEMEQKPLSDVELRCVCVCVCVCVCHCVHVFSRGSVRGGRSLADFAEIGDCGDQKDADETPQYSQSVSSELRCNSRSFNWTPLYRVWPGYTRVPSVSVRIRWPITDTQLFIHRGRGLPSRPTWRGSDSTTTCRVWTAIAGRGLRRGLDCSDIYTQSFPWEPGTLINIAPLAPLLF